MKTRAILSCIILSVLPISELRGAIPVGVASGLSLVQATAIAILCNALVVPLVFIFLETFHKLFYRIGFYAKLFDKFIAHARLKVHAGVEKYGYWGLMFFVAIPLPVTGAWTGTLGAWVLGMNKKKSILAITGGVVISGVIVALVVGFGLKALYIFVKKA